MTASAIMVQIEYALLCEQVIENNLHGLDLLGVTQRLHVLHNQPARKKLVLKTGLVGGNVQDRRAGVVGDLSVNVFRTAESDPAHTFQFLFEAYHWQSGFNVVTIQIPRTHSGQHTVQILNDLVLLHTLHYSVIER
jgi:hypothetical protein